MTRKATDKQYKFTSLLATFVSKRYLVKTSILEFSNKDISVAVSVYDVIEEQYELRFFSSDDAASRYIEMLRGKD